MPRGSVYLYTILDSASPRVLAWRGSNKKTLGFRLNAEWEGITLCDCLGFSTLIKTSNFTSLGDKRTRTLGHRYQYGWLWILCQETKQSHLTFR